MACYHFTMKLDRKPDKTPVNAAMHLEYIHRTGKFKNIDFRRAIELQEFSGNMLCPPKEENTEAVRRLYQSVYGSLIDNGIGIEASDGASVETLQIALSLATKKYGSLLNVSGSTEYKARVLVAASEMDLNVTFTEDAMNHEYSKLKEKIENGRRKSEGSRREGEQSAWIWRDLCEAFFLSGISSFFISFSLWFFNAYGICGKDSLPYRPLWEKSGIQKRILH